MKSFLIGSLPHKSVQAAVDFSLALDVATLPTLPLLDSKEMMTEQAGAAGEILSFVAQERFFAALKLQGRDAYKWQACGPLSSPATDVDFDFGFYADKLARTQKAFSRLAPQAQAIFFLDEPVLGLQPEGVRKLESFLAELRETDSFKGVVIGLHCCSKIGVNTLKSLSFDLYSLDCSLYAKDEIKELQSALKESLVYIPCGSKGERFHYPKHLERYASSACGLALSSPEQARAVARCLGVR